MPRAKGRRVVRVTGYLPPEAAKQFRALCQRLRVRVAAATRAALLRWITEQQRETNQ